MNHFDPTEYEGDPYEDWTLTAQQQHDVMACRRKGKLQPGSKQRLVTLLREKQAFDPIVAAMLDHPALTRERAEADARAAGF